MNTFSFLLRGIIVGFSVAAPVGPIGLLCIQRTLSQGRMAGLLSGLGAATADATYGFVAAFALTWASSFFIQQQAWLRPVGGTFLILLGLRTLLPRPAQQAAPATGKGLVSAYVSTFLLTLANPMTILSFAAIFAGLGLAVAGQSYLSAIALVLGVFLGSASWWLILNSGVALLRDRFSPRHLLWLNRISGLVIVAFGLSALRR